ncbi:MAG: response regulator [Alphaproteobacteria bacterium]|nr:response regulator [Alphaproteobacteria bacterium]
MALIVEEALLDADLASLAGLVAGQPAWSDFPFIVLSLRGAGLERNPGARRLMGVLGNVTFLERPFHPTTLVSVVQTALRSRRRQYEARRRIEEIRAAEAQFSIMVETIPQLAWMAEPGGRVFWYNQRWYDYTGSSPEEMAEQGWQAVHDPAVLPAFMTRWQASLKSGEPFEMTLALRAASGEFRPFLTRAAPIRDEAGRVLRWFGTNTDVTAQQNLEMLLERRVAERTVELEQANRQLAAQIVEREKIQSALRQAQRLEAVGQLTSGVAHDFNNLLTVVLGNARRLQKGASDHEQRRRLDMIVQAAERGAKLTAQLLAFSRRQKLEPKPVDLNETVSGMHDLLQSTMGGSIRIQVQLYPGLWPAMVDPTQIELVVLNLAINARDAMEVGGTLTVETANVVLGPPLRPEQPTAGDYVMVAVSDTGSGMSDEVLAKAFEPFFTTKSVGKGSGLGLSQVYGLAKQSGGGVRIATRPGHGTSVKVYLPRARAIVQAEPGRRRQPVDRQPKGAIVLLVDDDGAVREVTAAMLRDLGYGVFEAGSGGAALDLLERNAHVALVLLDFAMPGMNGAELAREIRTRRPGLPVLFATGYADASGLAGIHQDQIIRKPFPEWELADKLSRHLAGDATA